MADLPIAFSGPMVRALLREIEKPGTGKTQTRRVLNPQPYGEVVHYGWSKGEGAFWTDQKFDSHRLRYWAGDRLYVREHWRTAPALDAVAPREMYRHAVRYIASDTSTYGRFRQAMHMPKWASRITLLVTDVRVERLQEISPDDCYDEGVKCDMSPRPVTEHFRNLWDRLNGERAPWASNPWVAVYVFRPVLGNIDQIAEAA